jgi:hypothetical protein
MRKNALAKLGTIALGAATLILGAAALMQQPAHARPQPDCGPTFSWNCVVPGCPDCPEILFEGTRCEKAAFEKATGRTCSLA